MPLRTGNNIGAQRKCRAGRRWLAKGIDWQSRG
jgi:hypothetical protein